MVVKATKAKKNNLICCVFKKLDLDSLFQVFLFTISVYLSIFLKNYINE